MSIEEDDVYDVVVVGGGVVGLAILRAIVTSSSHRAVLIEKEPDLLHWASGSNSGIVCTGSDARVGTLERALLRDSIAQLRPYCRQMNLASSMRTCGSLVCQWPWDTEQPEVDKHALTAVLKESHDAGDTHASRLSSQEVLALEPNLNPSVLGAVHIPGEIVLDPWLYSISLAVHARENGASIHTSFEMDQEHSIFDGELWTIVRKQRDETSGRPSEGPFRLRARVVVNATGLWADELNQSVLKHDSSKFTCKPRRGQYRILSPVFRTKRPYLFHPIQPVPTQRTKGVFVFETIYNQIVVGPTATDQESKTDRDVDTDVSHDLMEVVRRILPSLQLQDDSEADDQPSSFVILDDYVGIRPGTDKRDYQIHASLEKRWITCAGIRSTGEYSPYAMIVTDLFATHHAAWSIQRSVG